MFWVTDYWIDFKQSAALLTVVVLDSTIVLSLCTRPYKSALCQCDTLAAKKKKKDSTDAASLSCSARSC